MFSRDALAERWATPALRYILNLMDRFCRNIWYNCAENVGLLLVVGNTVPALEYQFEDYHRTVVGYHGTSEGQADRLVSGDDFRASDADDEWFGKGIYFWEYAPKQAAELQAQGNPIPVNFRQHRKLDCAVFNYLYRMAEEAGSKIDTARAVYVPTAGAKRIWEGSWIYADAHIQICVRETRSILAVWHVRPDGRYGKQA